MNNVLIATLAIAILGVASVGNNLGLDQDQNAYGYGTIWCKWGSSTVTWKAGANYSSTNYGDTKLAIANINDVGSSLFLDETTGTPNINYYNWSDLNNLGWNGYTSISRVGSTCASATVFISNPATGGFSSQQRQNTIAHETLHAVGLDHTPSDSSWKTSLMYPTAANYNDHNIFVPTLDDIRALQSGSSYGSATSTSQCNTSVQSGSVTYTGTCSSGNPALPMTEKVTTAGSANRAFAYDSSTSLPSLTTLITTKVQPNTVYRFSTGVHTNTNVADGGSRYGTIEVDNDGFKAAWSFLGLTQTASIGTATPSTTKTYFLELVLQDGKTAAAYVFEDNGSASTAPTFIGKATFTPSGSWSGTKYTGTGVWTDSGSNPKSDYQVKEHFNRQKSYT